MGDEPFIRDADTDAIVRQIMRYGQVLTRTNADGTVDLYTPPQFIADTEDEGQAIAKDADPNPGQS